MNKNIYGKTIRIDEIWGSHQYQDEVNNMFIYVIEKNNMYRIFKYELKLKKYSWFFVSILALQCYGIYIS